MRVLVTGGAGFIGSHLVDRLLAKHFTIVVLDNFHPFYDQSLKRKNVVAHLNNPLYRLIEGDLRDDKLLQEVFSKGPFDVVVHLAAMAGVRSSLAKPAYYMDVNVSGTQKLLDHILLQQQKPRLVFGSSSSVYGSRSQELFSETDKVDRPISPYAASKVAGELLCYTAYHTQALPTICLRFFTVFGPRQRPDLAIHKFCRAIDQEEPIEVFGDGTSQRDYTYVSDIVSGIESAMHCQFSGYEVINLGRSSPITLAEMIKHLENQLGKQAKIIHKPVQMGDVSYTYANIEKAREILGYNPTVIFEDGVKYFVAWYQENKKSLLLGC